MLTWGLGAVVTHGAALGALWGRRGALGGRAQDRVAIGAFTGAFYPQGVVRTARVCKWRGNIWEKKYNNKNEKEDTMKE